MNRFVKNGEVLGGIVCKTKNIVIQRIQEGKNRRCYVIGNGHSLNVDSNNKVTKHDPGMSRFHPQIYKDDAVYVFYFTFECSGLEDAGREIADFVNQITEPYKRIILVGHSKCGLCLYSSIRFYQKNVTLVTISTPFRGTIVADKIAIEERVNSRILKGIYNVIFSDHNVDRDIIPNSEFINSIQNVSCKDHVNIISSLEGLSSCRDIMDLLLLIMDKILKINGDGIVSRASQSARSTRTIIIFCSHANSLNEGLKKLEQI